VNNLMIFENKPVEVFELNGQVLFNPYHCGECLELAESSIRDALRKMNSNQVIKLKNSDVVNSNIRKLNNAGENFLTESGVYKLIFKSKKKEAEKFQDWVTDEVLPQIRKTGFYKVRCNESKEKEIEARLINAKVRQANLLLKIANTVDIESYKKILQSKATEILNDGQTLIPLPKSERKTYSATEVGSMLGVTANKVGKLANSNNLKTGEYGELVWDKSKYSAKEVQSFRYYEEVIPVLKGLI
jgi:prophage antirepressor-like protein